MSYDFDVDIFESLGAGFGIFYLVYMLVCYGFGIACYVLRAAGFYSIAKRRGINHPWMSWIPGLDLWVLGCISDQYQYVVKGKTKNKRKWMIGLWIVLFAIWVVMLVLLGVMAFNAISSAANGISEAAIENALLGPMLGMLGCAIPMMGIAFAVMIIRYFAMYDLYTSCNPQNNVLFLVLSIFFSVTEPFFVFFNRKKDGGMPPRRSEPQFSEPPQYEQPEQFEEIPESQ